MITDPLFDRDHRRSDPALWSAESSDGMVATAHYLATRAGAQVLGKGGNAIDAAVAASLALGVCEPGGSGIGGMAMMLVRLASGRTFALPGPCRAPLLATPGEVAKSHRKRGYRAVAVPTQLAVLAHALGAHGTMSQAEVLAPAVELAERGIPITLTQATLFAKYAKQLARENGAAFFLDDGRPLAEGALLRQPVLAATLRRMMEAGFDDFYRGSIADAIAKDMEASGGFIRRADLEQVAVPAEVDPLRRTIGGREIIALPPPGGGTTIIEMLAIFEELQPDPTTVEGAVTLASIIRMVRQNRRRHYEEVREGRSPPDRMSREYAVASAREIRGETTHLSVMDRDGNTVALTQSLERTFGAKVVTPALGFCWNNYLQAFKVRSKLHPHYLRPGATARSNAAPTIVLRDGAPEVAIGSTGSERMASGIFQVLVRLDRQSPFEAVHAPRLHATPEGEVLLEEDRFEPGTLEALRARGFTTKRLNPYSFKTGGLQLVVRREDGAMTGVGEPRRDGWASGPITEASTRAAGR